MAMSDWNEMGQLAADARRVLAEVEEARTELFHLFYLAAEDDGEDADRAREELNDRLIPVDGVNARLQALVYDEDVDAFLGDLEVEGIEDVLDCLMGIISELEEAL